MTDLQLLEALIGFGMPLVVAMIVDAQWSSTHRALATVAVCIIVGALTAYIGGELSTAGYAKAILIILFAAMTAYKRFWVPLGLVNRNTPPPYYGSP